ncbi:hypothetical protein mRhiFer1_008856 [Rhinolophus ferrumequinum]|uniref:Uncharacterized protein n=1 Tax=Rhinolophus ferrumequinum TaxID=59479 RepID=A0A7J8AEH3_RHIFE|nr:hypothetical protein mRhiFer1_008856 [Rhinolophus ferrumequinum]
MTCAHPRILLYSKKRESFGKNATLPAVFKVPIRPHIVNFVHTDLRENNRQPCAVSELAGRQTTAESWGPGRVWLKFPEFNVVGLTVLAPRVLFGNMPGGGHMFAPTKTCPRWHRRVNTTQTPYATCSALAASALPALVMSKGHRIEEVPELPLKIKLKATRRPRRLFCFLRSLRPGMIE